MGMKQDSVYEITYKNCTNIFKYYIVVLVFTYSISECIV